MKKKLGAVVAALLSLSMAACSGGGKAPVTADQSTSDMPAAVSTEDGKSAGEATNLTLWTYPVGGWGNSEVVDELITDFNAVHPEISVTVEYLDYTNGDDQVNTAIEGGKAPDIILEGPERLVANWGAKGLMADLSDLMDSADAEDIYDNIKTACTAKSGEVYEYPLCMVAHAMAVNKAYMEEADAMQYVDEKTHTWKSTDDFFKAVQALYDAGHKDVASVYCAGQGGDQGTRALINNLYSGRFTNADHTGYEFNSEQNIKALEALKAQDGIKFDASIVGGDEINLFRQGVLAMSFCWNASFHNNTDNGEAGKTNNGEEILPLNFPTDDGKVELCGGIWGFGVFDNGNEAKIEAAKTFIDFMANGDEAVKAVVSSGFFPVHKNMGNVYANEKISATMDIFNKDFIPNMGEYYQIVPGWAAARTAWWNMLQRVGTGGDAASEAAAFDEESNAAAEAATAKK